MAEIYLRTGLDLESANKSPMPICVRRLVAILVVTLVVVGLGCDLPIWPQSRELFKGCTPGEFVGCTATRGWFGPGYLMEQICLDPSGEWEGNLCDWEVLPGADWHYDCFWITCDYILQGCGAVFHPFGTECDLGTCDGEGRCGNLCVQQGVTCRESRRVVSASICAEERKLPVEIECGTKIDCFDVFCDENDLENPCSTEFKQRGESCTYQSGFCSDDGECIPSEEWIGESCTDREWFCMGEEHPGAIARCDPASGTYASEMCPDVDDNPCTSAVCLPEEGCSMHTFAEREPCETGFCTSAAVCAPIGDWTGKTCGGEPMVCFQPDGEGAEIYSITCDENSQTYVVESCGVPDEEPCSAISCEAVAGCQLEHKRVGAACIDGPLHGFCDGAGNCMMRW